MIYFAHELQNKFKAGLTICGQEDEGELMWWSDRTKNQWDKYRKLEEEYFLSLEQ